MVVCGMLWRARVSCSFGAFLCREKRLDNIRIMTETETLTCHTGKQPNGDAPTNTSEEQCVFDHTYKAKTGARPPVVVVWRNVILMSLLHLSALYGLTLIPSASPLTLVWAAACYFIGNLGVTAGAHRLWSHRSYKASFSLRVFLMLCQSVAFQNDIYEWVRDHRVHHKYSETDADPHNAKRGFFFSHVGWLLTRKHPDVIERGKKLDLLDLKADEVVMFQKRYYKLFALTLCFITPTVVPWYFWGESLKVAYFVSALLRLVLSLNSTWLVNSAAHLGDKKPYDRNINPSESPLVAFAAVGEGFHNYHHTFPYDYSTSELDYWLNPTTAFIDLMCCLGLAKDRKRVSKETIVARMKRTGDSSHKSG
ncbi:acyl-CoA desaturase-like isoform X2 [Plectropomus leopardus]|uniref:acyl-CoA desaturase-like isoform X2 n=1 Tax=Plectropomus leopardus TaxID=160734 RepID=UPI001C4C2BC6|nr:acyl-CoA desaturase-like isoform X2 [Plectropomus leopardus]